MKNFVCFILLVASSFTGVSQTVQPIYFEAFWKATGIQSDVLYMSETEAALPVRGLKSHAISMMNDQAKEKWRTSIEGSVVGACKFHGNIMAIYSKSQKDQKYRELYAVTIDPSTGRTIENRSLLNTASNSYVAELYKTTTGEFQQLVLRYTNANFETEKIVLYDVSQDLQATQTASIDAAKGLSYQGAIVTPVNDLILFWLDKKGSLWLEQYSKGVPKGMLSMPVRNDGISNIAFSAIINPENSSDVLCFVKYKLDVWMIKTIFFDLKNNTVKMIDESLDKDYREKLQNESEVVGKAKQIPSAGFESLCVVAAEFYKNNPVIIKEVSGPNGNPPYSGVAVITVFDRDLKAKKSFLIDKQFRSNSSLPVLGHRLTDGKLQILSSSSKFVGASTLVFGEIDLDRLKWIKLVPVKVRRADPNSDPMDGNAMLWFGDKPLVPHHWGKQGYRYNLLDLNE